MEKKGHRSGTLDVPCCITKICPSFGQLNNEDKTAVSDATENRNNRLSLMKKIHTNSGKVHTCRQKQIIRRD